MSSSLTQHYTSVFWSGSALYLCLLVWLSAIPLSSSLAHRYTMSSSLAHRYTLSPSLAHRYTLFSSLAQHYTSVFWSGSVLRSVF